MIKKIKVKDLLMLLEASKLFFASRKETFGEELAKTKKLQENLQILLIDFDEEEELAIMDLPF